MTRRAPNTLQCPHHQHDMLSALHVIRDALYNVCVCSSNFIDSFTHVHSAQAILHLLVSPHQYMKHNVMVQALTVHKDHVPAVMDVSFATGENSLVANPNPQ